MREYSHLELDAIYRDYAQRIDSLHEEAKKAVVDWTYAGEWPHGLHPLFAELEMYSSRWKRRTLKFGPKESFEYWQGRGVDAEGRVRLLNGHNRDYRIFVYGEDFIDELICSTDGIFAMQRADVHDGLTRTLYDYRLDPHQMSADRFEYRDGRCVGSVEESEFMSDGTWEKASWRTVREFEYDEKGLAQGWEDMGPRLGGRKLMLRRPERKSKKQAKVRPRPLVAYAVDAASSDEGPEHAVYCDVYGLEMTYDDEMQLDVVPFIPAAHVSIIFDSTEVTSEGTVYAGAIPEGEAPDFEAIAETGAKWALLHADDGDASSRLASAWAAGLNVLVVAENEGRLVDALGSERPPGPERLAVALRPKRPVAPSGAQTNAKKIRAALTAIRCGESRIVLASGALKSDLEEYIEKPDVDGFYLEEGGYGAALEAAEQISVRRSEEGGD